MREDYEPEMKPCPFCGGEGFIPRNGDTNEPFGWASCDDCGADGGMLSVELGVKYEEWREWSDEKQCDEIAKLWNRRVDSK